MKLLQVVLCVVLALLGRGVTQEKTRVFGRPGHQDYLYKFLTYESSENFVFKKTLLPAIVYDPVADAEALYGATVGFLVYNPTGAKNVLNYNATKIINILTSRSMAQREDIAFAFEDQYHRSLVHVFECRLVGDFRKFILALMTPLLKYYASELKTALYSWRIAKHDIVDIILSMSDEGIRTLIGAYSFESDNYLKDDVDALLTGDFHTLIKALFVVKRSEKEKVSAFDVFGDNSLIGGDATVPHNITTLITIFTSRSFEHLKAMCHNYYQVYEKEIETVFIGLKDQDFLDGLLAIVDRARSRENYFSVQLHEQAGRNLLIRILVGRCEIDLRAVQDQYYANYRKQLHAHLSGVIKEESFLTALESLLK